MGKITTLLSAISFACIATRAETQEIAVPLQDAIAPTQADIEVARIEDLGAPFDLRANLYLPVHATTHSVYPLVLYIHGKGGSYADPRDKLVQRLLKAFLSEGIAVARVDYRRSGRMPQMLFDVKSYIRYFRAHATEYGIDPNRIGIWGMSRGGNLAALWAVTGDIKDLDGIIGGNTEQPTRVDAAVIESPLTDLFLSSDAKSAAMFGDYLGTNADDSMAIVKAYRSHNIASPFWRDVETIERVNPLRYVRRDSPPALIICGGLDPSNVIINCSAFFDRYIHEGATASYYALSTGTHVRVGSDIEAASVKWMSERLAVNPPPLYPDSRVSPAGQN